MENFKLADKNEKPWSSASGIKKNFFNAAIVIIGITILFSIVTALS
ncbi:hypothetical protein HY412_00430 [Candidatus Kaiserbacteria bacterium]|nr:hypothetical protein [Candidatus Kaiserbacteria bacterium]